MTSLVRDQSRACTSITGRSSFHHRTEDLCQQFKEYHLKKSVFKPPHQLAEAFAARRHFAGADVPKVEIVHYCPRWLLLQAPRTKANFFEKLNSGYLGCRQEQILRVFKGFVGLIKIFGLFRPTEKMIFLQKKEVLVWINEDIFSNTLMMPIVAGEEGEKHFVIAFLAMIETYLDNWDRPTNIYRIDDALKMLEWRLQLAKGSRQAVFVSQEVNYSPDQEQNSLHSYQVEENKKIAISQQIHHQQQEEEIFAPLTGSFGVPTHRQAATIDFNLVKTSRQASNSEYEAESPLKKKFALNTTTSTFGNFCQKWRTTVGRKNLMEKVQSQDPQTPNELKLPVATIQMEFDGLFSEDETQRCNEAELEKIAQEIEQVLIW